MIIGEEYCQSSATYLAVVTTGLCILDGRALLPAYTYKVTHFQSSAGSPVYQCYITHTSFSLSPVLLLPTVSPQGLRSELQPWPIVVSFHPSCSSQVGSYLRTVEISFANRSVILAFCFYSSQVFCADFRDLLAFISLRPQGFLQRASLWYCNLKLTNLGTIQDCRDKFCFLIWFGEGVSLTIAVYFAGTIAGISPSQLVLYCQALISQVLVVS